VVPIPEGVEREDEEPKDESYGEGIRDSGNTTPVRSIFKAMKGGRGRSIEDLRGNGSC
jgi:hypothetical protein